PPRAAVGLGEWRAIRRRSPLQIYLRPACGPAAPVGWRSIPPAVASRQWSVLSGGRSLHSHWALFEICSNPSLPVFKVASRVIALPSDPSSARNGNVRATGCRFGLFGHRKYLVWSFARAIECLTKNQDAMRLDPR